MPPSLHRTLIIAPHHTPRAIARSISGVGIILLQDFATKLATSPASTQTEAMPRFTLDDVHFGGSEVSSVEDVMYDQVADVLQGKGLSIPDTRDRIAEAYGGVDEVVAKKNTREL